MDWSRIAHDSIICWCKRVTKQSLIEAIQSGHNSLDELGDSTKAGTHCNRCHKIIEDLIETYCVDVETPKENVNKTLSSS